MSKIPWNGTGEFITTFGNVAAINNHTMYKDFSIHFTIKDQELDVIQDKFQKFVNESGLLNEENSTVRIHSCFLPRKVVEKQGFDTALVDYLETLTDNNDVNWYYAGTTLGMSRIQMLENIKRLGGVAIFIGEVRDGVLEELNLAKEIGTVFILIP
jgi:hypothetical protein